MREDSDLAILREMANLAREYFDERNRPAVSWDGMPSVQEQKHRRERIVAIIDRLSSAPSRGSDSGEPQKFDEDEVAFGVEARAPGESWSVVYPYVVEKHAHNAREFARWHRGCFPDYEVVLVRATTSRVIELSAAPLVTESAGGTNG